MFFTSCPCICVRPCISLLDNRHKTKKKLKLKKKSSHQIRKRQTTKWRCIRVFFSICSRFWPSTFRGDAFSRWDVILMMYCWLSIDKFTFIIYIYPCTLYTSRFFTLYLSILLRHALPRLDFVSFCSIYGFWFLQIRFSFIFQFKCVPSMALFIVISLHSFFLFLLSPSYSSSCSSSSLSRSLFHCCYLFCFVFIHSNIYFDVKQKKNGFKFTFVCSRAQNSIFNYIK